MTRERESMSDLSTIFHFFNCRADQSLVCMWNSVQPTRNAMEEAMFKQNGTRNPTRKNLSGDPTVGWDHLEASWIGWGHKHAFVVKVIATRPPFPHKFAVWPPVPHRFVARGPPSHRLQMAATFPIYIHRMWPSHSHHTKFIQTGGQIHETYRAWQAINFQTWPLSTKLHQQTTPGPPHTSSPQETTNAFGVQVSVGPRQTL